VGSLIIRGVDSDNPFPRTNPHGYRSTCCDAPMPYVIAEDAYVCQKCRTHFGVLSTERDHVMYDGGPPREVTKSMPCHVPPEKPLPDEFIQSTVSEPQPVALQARRNRAGGWDVSVTTDKGVQVRLVLPSEAESRK
jgi:acetyl-CoA carboxylase beta subunit